MTPRELTALINGAVARAEASRDQAVWLAWHVASLSRAKRIPKLKQLLSRKKRKRQPQTWREQLAIAHLLNAAFGGETKVKDG